MLLGELTGTPALFNTQIGGDGESVIVGEVDVLEGVEVAEFFPGEEGKTVGVAVQVLVELLPPQGDEGEQRAVAVLGQQQLQEGLEDLQVEVEPHVAEAGGLQVGEEDRPHLEVAVAAELVDALHPARPLLVDLGEPAHEPVVAALLPTAQVLQHLSQTDVHLLVGGGEGLQRAGLEVLAEEGVVLLLDAFLQFAVGSQEVLEVGAEFVLDAFEAEEDVQFGELGVVVDAVEAGLHVRHHCQHLLAVEGGDSGAERGAGDVHVLAVQLFEEGEEVGEDVEGVEVLQVHVGVVDVGEVVEHLAPEPRGLVLQNHLHYPPSTSAQQTLHHATPQPKADQQLLLQLPQLVDEVEGQEGSEGGQVILEPLADEGEEEAGDGLPQEVGGDQLHLLRLRLPDAHLLQQVAVVGVESQLQVLEHPPRLLKRTQLRIADEQVADGRHAAPPVQFQQSFAAPLLPVQQAHHVPLQSYPATFSVQVPQQDSAVAFRRLFVSDFVLFEGEVLLRQHDFELLPAGISCLVGCSNADQNFSVQLFPESGEVDICRKRQVLEFCHAFQGPLKGRMRGLDIQVVCLQKGLYSPHDGLALSDNCQLLRIALQFLPQFLIPPQTVLPHYAPHSPLQLAAALLHLERLRAHRSQLLQPHPRLPRISALHCVDEPLQLGGN